MTNGKKTFRDLIVWRKSIELATTAYRATECFPDAERYGLTSQMRRAAVSIPSNIAEGNARQGRADYIRFLTIARGSLAELETQLVIAHKLCFLAEKEPLMEPLREVDRLLQALIRSLKQ